jgi:hypothetical protein
VMIGVKDATHSCDVRLIRYDFRVKSSAHLHWPQPSMPFAEAIVLLI